MSGDRILELIGAYFALGFGIALWYKARGLPARLAWSWLLTGMAVAAFLLADMPDLAMAGLFFGLGFWRWSICWLASLKVLGAVQFVAYCFAAGGFIFQSSNVNCDTCSNASFGGFAFLLVAGFFVSRLEARHLRQRPAQR